MRAHAACWGADQAAEREGKVADQRTGFARSIVVASALVLLLVSCQTSQRPTREARATMQAEQDAERAVLFEEHMTAARDYWDEEMYEEALASVAAALKLEPRSEEAWQLQREVA